MNIFIINLPTAIERRAFQQQQLDKLGLEFEFINAITTNDIDDKTYKKHYYDWQRPLQKTEVACYFSHQKLWLRVIADNQPALILEDDALLSKCVPKLLKELSNKKKIDLITLENRGRKKTIAKTAVNTECHSKIFKLYQDRTGAAGYILWPKGAKKLMQHEAKKGIALADAHIATCYSVCAYQVEPAPIIQLDQCNHYKIKNGHSEKAAVSIINNCYRPKKTFFFRMKRLYFQVKLGLHQLLFIVKSERRYINTRAKDFF